MRGVKNQHLPLNPITIEMLQTTVEVLVDSGLNSFLAGAPELSVGGREIESCTIELDHVSSVGEDFYLV
jgi:hypothetical protein